MKRDKPRLVPMHAGDTTNASTGETQRNWKADGIKGAISRVDTYDDSRAVF